MTEKEKLIEDHEYDGIKELNNPLPGWWLMTFYVTVIFAVIYFAYYQLFGGPTLDQELQTQMSSIKTAQEKTEEAAEVKTQADYLALVSSPEAIAKGKTEFLAKCMPCHGDKGQGIIGPNLTDDYWIHGDGTIPAILTVMNTGVPDKGMPSWKGVIAPDLQQDVAAYVYSIHGTNPPGAKAPQGQMIERK
ncbi:MAG TPA: cbb3-type cytochrome c oxidase N-terminal domain-containing protein [Thermodesulfobacteriota bacterium]|nr:cbb3-type cytochrome c oxidase N-terminal domain-containing protein [Thermodesulfobacteriota bacterium]